MTDFNIDIAAAADNGYCYSADWSHFNDDIGYGIPVGDWNGNRIMSYFRFDNVTIPKGFVIVSAVLRCQAGVTTPSGMTANLYFEAADDPAAPVSGADMSGRALTDAVSWTIPSWTDNSNYDSEDIASILQDIIDRPEWVSGQAVIVYAKATADDSVYRMVKSTTSDAANVAELRVTYTQAIDVHETITVSESIEIDTDERIAELNEGVGVSEYLSIEVFEAWRLFSRSENIAITEAITIELEIPVVGSRTETIAVIENLDVIIPLGGEFNQPIAITEFLDIALDIPPSWVALANAGLAKERYYFTLTGSADATTDIEIPISNFQARKRTAESTYLSVVIDDYSTWAAAIAARSNGEMIIEMAYEYDGDASNRQTILIVDLENINLYNGPTNRSINLSGHRTITFANRSVTLENPTYEATVGGRRTFRFAKCDPYLNPGDTLLVGEDSMTIDYIVYMVSDSHKTMEVKET